MAVVDPQAVVLKFNAYINQRDLMGLSDLLAPDHLFIDSAKNRVKGKAAVTRAWKGFFQAFPDYRNHFEQVQILGNEVTIAGHSTCSDERLEGPALWRAQVQHGQVSEWQVYDDTPGNRGKLRLGLNV